MTITLGSIDKRLAALASLWLALAPAKAACAQQTATRVEVTGCVPDVAARVQPALDVELTNASADARRALDEGTLRCELICDGDLVTARVLRGSERVEQRIEGAGAGLARRVAIVLAELIEASSGPEPTDASLGQTPPDPPRPAPGPEPALRTRLRVAGGAWIGGEPLVVLGTIELGVELAPSRNVALVVGAAGTFGTVDVERARLDVRVVSAVASLRFGADVDALWLGGGPAVRGGAVVWTGTPSDPTHAMGETTVGGWLGLGAVGAAFVRLGTSPVRLGVEVEGGAIAIYSGATVLGTLAAQIGGGWLELRLAADVTFD